MNKKQIDTFNNISPRGLMINTGSPCECGEDSYVTRKERKYSDTMLYKHRCTECKNEFSTWSEG